ncbi:MAG: Mth938-like domain-containing protein [Hydrogenophaga sp.]|uniref:Mth938-like domain-containing protein n=1 Tax=Hydrogenophaga sp. TaxID=1904254 RepID=UPI003D0B7318
MKLHADQPDGQSITAYGPGWVAVNGQRKEHSLVLSATGTLQDWNCARFEDLTAAHFEQLGNLAGEAPELVVFGSGARLRFVRPALLQSLMAQRIGVETMDTAAACRTFNILAGEGRRVVVALLVEV